ncbi:MAG TPA: hypothetical protein VJQ61_08725 [Sinomonas sp.]|nr:hypothetical protein [Sinomonas sp.]
MTDLSAPLPSREAPRLRRRPDGPNAGILAVVALCLSVAAALLLMAISPAVISPGVVSTAPYPPPSAPSDVVGRFFGDHAFSAMLIGFLAFGASVPLAIYAATSYSRLLRLGIRVPGPSIGFAGGIVASIALAVSALLVWALGATGAEAPAAVVRLVAVVAFALGGVGFATGLGLLIAGIAVPALILRLTPRWLAWAGLVLAALGELSFFTLLVPGAAYILPVVRFAGLGWLAVVGFLLPQNRHDVPNRPDPNRTRANQTGQGS